jgi:hypothetical protein|tara:strand:- start:6143 stop:6466 length:324 start_codon:yes stop_codon:yes gene_type:complete
VKGSDFLEKAKAQYDDIGLKTIDLEGMGIIYYKPMTLADRKVIQQIAKVPSELPAATVVVKALDENGDRMFSNTNKVDLIRGVQAELLDEVASQLIEIKSVEERVRD